MLISQEMRSKISQLDDLANEIREYLEDNQLQYEDENFEALHEMTEAINGQVTSFQESQGWI